MNRRFAWAAVAAVMVGLTACSSGSTDADSDSSRTIVDGAGRKVEVPDDVQRVATVGSVPVLNSFPFAVGMGDRIVNGMPTESIEGYESYETMAPELLKAPTVQPAIGADLSIEDLLELEPDVVLTSDPDQADDIEDVGIPAVVLSLESGEKIKESVEVTGELFGEEERAAEYVDYFDETIDRVEAVAEDIPGDRKPSVLYIDTRPLRRPNLVMEWMLETIGANSVTKDVEIGQYEFTAEQLLSWDPELLIGMRPYDRDDLFGDPRFENLQAVQNDDLVIVPTGIQIWGNNTAEQPLALLWVATQVFPDDFDDVDMVEETKEFYDRFFEIDLTDKEVETLLAAKF